MSTGHPGQLVWWKCTKHLCKVRFQQPEGARYVSHQAPNGDEHPMKKEVKP